MSNNKYKISFATSFPYTTDGNATFVNSNLDALIAFANDVDIVKADNSGTIQEGAIDTNFAWNQTSASTCMLVYNSIVRQDLKVLVPKRLPQVTENMMGIIVSQNDSFSSYFYNSILYNTASGYVRVGITNFTANQATNPFAPGQQSVLNAVWSWLDLNQTQ